MRQIVTVLALAGALMAVPFGSAAVLTWTANLDQSQENPPTGSPAMGFGTVEFDDETNVLSLDLEWMNLTSLATMAHIHCCTDPSGNAGVVLDLWLPPDSRPTTGTYSAMYDLDDPGNGPFREAFVTANGGTALGAFGALATQMDQMRAYYNIHTEQFGPGEIRGNLAPIPEPGSVVLLLSGVGAVFAARRFKRA